jgi:hypothetical protein
MSHSHDSPHTRRTAYLDACSFAFTKLVKLCDVLTQKWSQRMLSRVLDLFKLFDVARINRNAY